MEQEPFDGVEQSDGSRPESEKIKSGYFIEDDKIFRYYHPEQPGGQCRDRTMTVFDKYSEQEGEGPIPVFTSQAWDILVSRKKGKFEDMILGEIEKRVSEGQLSNELAVGLVALNDYERKPQKIQKMPESGDGLSSDSPKVKGRFWSQIFPGIISRSYTMESSDPQKASIKISSKKMRQRQEFREINILDDEGNLTESAWDILKNWPGKFANFCASTLSNPHLDEGEWVVDYRFSQMIRTSREEQKKIQQTVLDIMENNPQSQEAEVVRSILKNYEIFGQMERKLSSSRETEVIQEPIISKVDAKITEPVAVEISSNELRDYLTNLELPQGARIENLNLSFVNNQCDVSGQINVPIAFVGGKIDFSLSLTQEQGRHLGVKNVKMSTESKFLKGQLSKVEGSFSDIDQLLLRTLNERLRNNTADSLNLGDQKFIMGISPKYKG